MATKKYSFDAPEGIMASIDYRGRVDGAGRAYVIWRTLERYLDLINRCKVVLCDTFNERECGLILDACNGVMLSDPMSVQLLPFGIADGIDLDKLDQKWGVDGDALMAKLNATNYADRLAIADSIQLWWLRHSDGENPQYGELFTTVKADVDSTLSAERNLT